MKRSIHYKNILKTAVTAALCAAIILGTAACGKGSAKADFAMRVTQEILTEAVQRKYDIVYDAMSMSDAGRLVGGVKYRGFCRRRGKSRCGNKR